MRKNVNASPVYEIQVQGHLDPGGATWLETLTIDNRPNGDAVLTLPVADPSALHGLLNRVFALNLTLISVNRIQSEATEKEHHNEQRHPAQ